MIQEIKNVIVKVNGNIVYITIKQPNGVDIEIQTDGTNGIHVSPFQSNSTLSISPLSANMIDITGVKR